MASQVVELFPGQLKGKILREAVNVALHGPNQRSGLDVIELGQVGPKFWWRRFAQVELYDNAA